MKTKDKNSPKQIISSREDKFTFGKHQGQTVEYVLDDDPGYIVWLDEEKIVKFPDEIYQEAQQLDSESYDLRNGDFWGIDPYDFMDEPY